MQTRRELIGDACCGMGALALNSLMAEQVRADLGTPRFNGKAKSVIFLFMAGRPSQFESFDYKPLLKRAGGKKGLKKGTLLAPQTEFARPV